MSSSEQIEQQVTALKEKGNAQLQAGQLDAAVASYSAAVTLMETSAPKSPQLHVVLSNRSSALLKLKRVEEALADADRCISLNAQWSKGFLRRGQALTALGRHSEAVVALEGGLKLEPSSAPMMQALREAQAEEARELLLDAFSGDVVAKARLYPETKALLEDADVVDTLKSLAKAKDLARIESALRTDKSIATYAAVMMQYARLEKLDPKARDALLREQAERAEKEAKAEAEREERIRKERREREAKEKAEAKAKELAALTPTQREGRALKEKGNEKFKAKDYAGALKDYEAAYAVDSSDVTYLTNAAACHLELGQAEQCVAVSERALEQAREQRADFKVVARALQRLGSAHLKQGDYAKAVDAYKKSLVEERTPETLAMLKKAEKLKEEAEARAYRSPELAAEAKEKGNALFKAQKFPEAVAAYSEAIKRAPEEATYYTNRATAYSKLLAYPEALKDLDKAIELKPDFVKAYIKKAHLHTLLKEYKKALELYDTALKYEPDNNDVLAGVQQVMGLIGGAAPDEETVRKNVARDPEVQRILRDPKVQAMLKDVQADPSALERHLQDPTTRANFDKLVAAGVIRQG